MRRRSRSLIVLASLLALVFFASGCQKPPTAEITAAREAIDVAQSAGAPEYAPASWAATAEARDQLDVELQAQQDKTFAFTRSYASAQLLAVDVKTAAEKATADAVAGKEAARTAALQSIDQVRAMSVEVRELMDRAPQGKGTAADLAALRSDAGATESSLAEAESAYAAEKYLEAKAKADVLLADLQRVRDELLAANAARRPA
jgi:hypothetical protein